MIGSEKVKTQIRQLWKAYIQDYLKIKDKWKRGCLKGTPYSPFYLLYKNSKRKNWLGIVSNWMNKIE